jgi:hypothetical protein
MSPSAEIFNIAVVLRQRRAIRCASGRSLNPSRFHRRDFDDFPLGVVGGPFACLFAIVKMPRPHFSAVFPEPLPISGQHVIDGMTLGLDGSVLVTVDAFLYEVLLANNT